MIAIDIHDTIGDYIYAMIVRYGPPTDWPQDGHRTLHRMWPNVDMDTHFEPQNHTLFLAQVPAFLEAPNSVWRLRQMGLDFCYFTATPPVYYDVIKTWLSMHNFPPAKIRMADGWTEKATALEEYDDIQLLIEDSPSTLNAAADLGISTYIYDRPWNRDVVVGTRVLNWNHILWQLTRDLSLYGIRSPEWE